MADEEVQHMAFQRLERLQFRRCKWMDGTPKRWGVEQALGRGSDQVAPPTGLALPSSREDFQFGAVLGDGGLRTLDQTLRY